MLLCLNSFATPQKFYLKTGSAYLDLNTVLVFAATRANPIEDRIQYAVSKIPDCALIKF